ncbi:SDR family oxidoreductase [Virgibacillus necropolis]|uniref:Oxidoreductase n=1 Tax=Virgibacillus necropolis TaxID=163877 RepID=A0A221MAA9_9BACI|nr:SDR family oxidoreductase [Virgibacillus necropolis]ASN04596.1 oxidoreductase [Virgibacillus necropolis]
MFVQEKIAIVTGVSHAHGIGAAVCRKLAANGCAIFFTYWEASPDWATTFQKEMLELGVRCAGFEVDLSEPHAPFELLDMVESKMGLPTILVNNAAYSTRDGYQQLDVQTLDNHYAVNMRATFLLCVEFARRFKKAEGSAGRVINMTSGQAQGPMLEELAYGATKAAISGFTLTLSAEVAPLGITVNAVNPGPTDTGWMTADFKQELSSQFLMGRMGMPEDAAHLIGFLASDEAEWITGQVINSEGGFLRK